MSNAMLFPLHMFRLCEIATCLLFFFQECTIPAFRASILCARQSHYTGCLPVTPQELSSSVPVDVVEEVSFCTQLHDKEGFVRPYVCPQELDDIRVMAGLEKLDLPLKAHLLLTSRPFNHFDGHSSAFEQNS